MLKSHAAIILRGSDARAGATEIQKQVQQGTQQRSCVRTMEAIDKIHNGLIGRAYFAKGWYSNTRKSIGIGKAVPVPAQLDWDLWQGPAPRRPYMDNIHPYNWHWFKHWGTGEALNNGTIASIYAAGRSKWIIRRALQRRAGDTSSRMTGSFMTPW